ncbi:MAG TPA: alpha/beta hydrolase-fold protein [Caulobacteraceae bacterium]|nr:alpha/beta hydrolase-fold protein [Caulobacteraceae bacterium]
MAVAERLVDYLHPRLAALRDNPGGETGFWAEIERERTPLIEADPQLPGYSIVSYVFPTPAEARHVAVHPGYGNARDHVMDRVLGTAVRHAAYRYRNDVRTTYSFAPDVPLIPFDEASEADIATMMAFMREHPPIPDPHARDHFLIRYSGYAPDQDTSILALPDAPAQSQFSYRKGVARGAIDLHPFRSESLGNERRIWVYTPPGYAESSEEPYPVLVAFDGGSALSTMPMQHMLDNLIADGRIRPHVAVFIDNATDTSRNDDLPCSEPFAKFVEAELLPWVRGNYRVSHEARDHTVTGVSYGGLASMWFGYRLPHVFGTVISQAASLWWGPGWVQMAPMNAQNYSPEWLTEQYARAPRLPVRFWMEIGLMEHPERMLETNRRMKGVLEAKGYDLTYSEPCGGHDYALWRGTLGDALAKMLPAAA